MKSEISERSLSIEKRENPLRLETNDLTDNLSSRHYSSIIIRVLGSNHPQNCKRITQAILEIRFMNVNVRVTLGTTNTLERFFREFRAKPDGIGAFSNDAELFDPLLPCHAA